MSGEGLLGGAVRRPVALLVSMCALLVVSFIAYLRLPLELMPPGLRSNGLQVWVSNPGASAEENEAKVVRVIEEQVRTLSGVTDVYSSAREDSANVEVDYDRGFDMDAAKAELRDRLERARPQLPDTVERMGVWSFSGADMPLMFLAVLHPEDSDRSDYLLDTVVQRRLEAVDGVSQVEFFGMLDESIRILLDEERVKAAQLDIGALIRRLSADNFARPLGEVEDGGRRVLLRSDMRFRTQEEVAAYPVGDGLTLGDLGSVERVQSVRDRLSRIDGRFAYFGQLRNESGANLVETSHRVRAALNELEADPQIAGELQFLVFFSQGDMIETSLDQLRDTALWGGVLAALVLLVFLRRVRVTVVVALCIPVSMLLALQWVYFSGGSLNLLSMAGLTLALGMLVDNAVVVVENIARLRSEGRPPLAAASEGVRDVGLAVTLATLTTMVVFLPVIFMTSNPMVRLMFGALGLPLCVSLLASLGVALVFLPAVSARIVGPRHPLVERAAALVAVPARLPALATSAALGLALRALHLVARGLHALERAIVAVLVPARWVLAPALLAFCTWRVLGLQAELHELQPLFGPGMAPSASADALRGMQVAWIGAALLGAGLLVFGVGAWRRRPRRYAPPAPAAGPHATSFVDLLVLGNRKLLAWSLDHRLLASGLSALAFASAVIPAKRLEVTGFGQDESRDRIEVRIDLEDNFTLAEASRELASYEEGLAPYQEELGYSHVSSRFNDRGGRLTLWWELPQAPEEFARRRARLQEIWAPRPGHKVAFYGDEQLDTRNRSIVTFQLFGPDPDVLAELGRQALARLEQVPGLSGLSSPLEDAPAQVRVNLDPEKAWQLGVTAQSTLQNIAWTLRGFQLPRFQEAGRELPFLIEYDEDSVAGLHTLRDLDVFNGAGAVALSSFADLEFAAGPRVIRRHNGRITYSLQARVDDPNRQRQLSDAGYAALRELELPRGYALGDETSVTSRQDSELAELRAALLLSVLLVFLLMAVLFESLTLPFVVMFTTVPFAIVGSLWTFFLTGRPMDFVGWIGLIILIGVVVNNGIVLVDRIRRLHVDEGLPRREAVLRGGATRVRPILMTAMTTVFGLGPMALATPPAEGIDYRALATCIGGGLTLSTFFTLWVVPLCYTLVDDFVASVGRSFGAGVRRLRRLAERARPA